MNVANVEKIGTVEVMEVHRSGRRTYVNLNTYTVQTYEIKSGDLVKLKILEVHRQETDEEE